MTASHYKPELADTIYQEVFFAIDGDQFPEDADLAHEVDGRIHEQDEAEAAAQVLADRFRQTVEIAVYGTWGNYGKEYIETIKVKSRCPIEGLRQDLAEILAQMGA